MKAHSQKHLMNIPILNLVNELIKIANAPQTYYPRSYQSLQI